MTVSLLRQNSNYGGRNRGRQRKETCLQARAGVRQLAALFIVLKGGSSSRGFGGLSLGKFLKF